MYIFAQQVYAFAVDSTIFINSHTLSNIDVNADSVFLCVRASACVSVYTVCLFTTIRGSQEIVEQRLFLSSLSLQIWTIRRSLRDPRDLGRAGVYSMMRSEGARIQGSRDPKIYVQV